MNHLTKFYNRLTKKTVAGFASMKALYAAGVAGLASLVLAPLAMASGGGLGAAALAEITGIRGDVLALLLVLVGIVFLLVGWAYFKKAK